LDSKQTTATVPAPANQQQTSPTEGKCPVAHGNGRPIPQTNAGWWPNQLNVNILHQHSPLSDPMGKEFNYAEEFKSLDLNTVAKDLHALMTDSQEWWPADFGHYGPLFKILRLRRRTRRRLGAQRGYLLGSRRKVAGGRALQRRS
jgi:catalase-peroxidase